MEDRRRYFEWKVNQPGRLMRHESWRHAYLCRPYLIGAPDERVADRFRDIFLNVMEIGPDGKVCPVPLEMTDEYMQVFTHLLEEYGARTGGMPPDEVVSAARHPVLKYFESGIPPGVTMFGGYKRPDGPIVVKYGKRQYLEPMFGAGTIRLANARLYNNTSFSGAVRDNETSRTFYIPTFNERLSGKDHVDFQGHRLNFDDDDIVLPIEIDDYYFLSLCDHIHYRMPTDFDADAALIVRDPVLFNQRVISAFLARFPGWIPMEGKIIYYDPYRDYTKFKVPEMAKHIGYAFKARSGSPSGRRPGRF